MVDSDETYEELFKALASTHRLSIVAMLSRGERCACEILEKFAITQPTLSHHMRILCNCGLVLARKDGKWTYYSLNQSIVHDLQEFFRKIHG